MLVHMELARIIISDINDHQVIYLREVDGERTFPIVIGLFEAHSIDRRVKVSVEHPPPHRPLTHDLIKNVIEQLGGETQDVVINDLRDHTYYAVIRILVDGELIEIDSRPSDAIALSVHYDPFLPIYVAEEVLDEASL
ncbi:MAG: bifunctional nuclease family protein [Planctomycetaceae bacterium]